MKRKVYIGIVLLLGLIVFGYWNYVKTDKKVIGEDNDLNYTIIDQKYKDKKIQIVYPQLTHLSDENKQRKLNEMIRKRAIGSLESMTKEEYSKFTIETNYEITLKSDKLISITFTEDCEYEGSNHPNKRFYSMNIDLDNAQLIGLSDLVKIDMELIKKLKSAEMISPAIEKESNSLWIFSDEDLIAQFKNADTRGTDFCSYLTRDSIGVSIPISHASGDHAEFEIKYTDLLENRTNNPMWKYLLR